MSRRLYTPIQCFMALVLFISTPFTASAAPTSYLNPLTYINKLSSKPAADALIEAKVRNAEMAPAWVKELQVRTLRSYFAATSPGQSLQKGELDALMSDATRLLEYYEQEDTQGIYKNVAEKWIKPFVYSLNITKLNQQVRFDKISEQIGNWSVESLVVRMQLKSIAGLKERVQHALDLVVGPHLRGASKLALVLAIAGTVLYVGRDFGGEFLTVTVIASIVAAFRSGPLATLMNAGTAWFLNPTVEYIKVLNNRYTAWIETRINNFYDRVKPSAQNEEDSVKANVTPKLGNVEEDGTNYGGMTVEDKKKNWSKLLRMWVAVAKHYYKLLRDTHHLGRGLVFNQWNEEMNSAHFIETMDSKLIMLTVEEAQLLLPYQTAFLVRDEHDKKDVLDTLFDDYRNLCSKVWMENLSEAELVQLRSETIEAQKKLQAVGISAKVMEKLWDIQVRRAHTVDSLVTGVTINELKLFSSPEGNRNLDLEAREVHRASRRGFDLQRFTQTYAAMVANRQSAMGFTNSTAAPNERAALSCEARLLKAFKD